MNILRSLRMPKLTIRQWLKYGLGAWLVFGLLNATRFCFCELKYIPQLELCRRAHPERDIRFVTGSQEYYRAYPNGRPSDAQFSTCRITGDALFYGSNTYTRPIQWLFGLQVRSARLEVPFRVRVIDGCGYEVNIRNGTRLDNDHNRNLRAMLNKNWNK